MAVTSSRAAITERHRVNALLQAPILSPLRQGPRDLGGDQVAAPLSAQAIAQAVQALEQGNTHYVDVAGVATLRDALRDFVEHLSTPQATLQEIMVTAGMQESRFLSIQVLGDQLGTIAVPAVCDPGVRLAAGVRPFGLQYLVVDETSGMLPSVEAIQDALEDGCRLVYLESPSRLSGAMFSPETVQAIAALLTRHDATVIWDQGLAPWVAPGRYASIGGLEGMAERSLLLGEAWPGTGLDGLFVAYLAAPAARLPALVAQKQILSICTSTPSQFAALAASEDYAAAHAGQQQRLAALRDQLTQRAEQLGDHLLPGATATIFAGPEDGAILGRLAQRGYTSADGAAFGAPGIRRLAIIADDEIAALDDSAAHQEAQQ